MLPPRVYLLAGAAVLAALVVANTYRLSAAVDRARAELAQCAAERQSLQDAVNEQNAAVERWERSAFEARERATRALAEVEAAEHSRRAVKERLEAYERQAGESECDAARRVIQEYRK